MIPRPARRVQASRRMATAIQIPHTAPRLYLLALMTEDNERRNTPTLEAPPLSDTDRDTTPPDADAEAGARDALRTLLPIAGAPSYFDEAIRIVAEAGRDIREGRQERLRFDQSMTENQRAILAAIQKADQNSTTNFEALRHEVRRHRELGEARDNDQDLKIAAVERAIVALKQEVLDALPEAMSTILTPFVDRIEALEREAAELRANARPPQSSAPPG